MLLSEPEARKIALQALSLSKADACVVTVSGHDRAHMRFALNGATTNGGQKNVAVTIESHLSKRTGSATVNELDAASLTAAVRKSEEIARLAPVDPEYQPPLGPQKYLPSRTYYETTARADAEKLAALCAPVLKEADEKKVSSAGFLHTGRGFSLVTNSNHLSGYERNTMSGFTVSARSPDGTGSGWAGNLQHDIARLDTAHLGKTAVSKTLDSRNPTALPPGKHTVILEPSAVCDLVGMMLGRFDARQADEGRSFLTKKGGGNKLGEKLFSDKVTIYSDPHHDLAPGSVYSTDALPAVRRTWINNGAVGELIYSRYWAQKTGHEPVPFPTNAVMAGGTTSLEDMVRDTKRGILVTRLWYIREVDPRTLLFTGLTRDGTFLIESGKITRALKNFRFNESPVAMLNNVEAIGPAVRTVGSEVEDWSVCVPPLLVRDFTFSSVSDAV
jgi:predicted Zn-dependent protease